MSDRQHDLERLIADIAEEDARLEAEHAELLYLRADNERLRDTIRKVLLVSYPPSPMYRWLSEALEASDASDADHV